jgi:mono/diheme cytochrome c family protein
MMRRWTRSLAIPVRAALFLGAWLFLLTPTLSLLLPPGETPGEWQAVARAEESRPPTPKAIRRLFESRCLRCHDEDGSGREMRTTLPSVPDFTSRKWHKQRSTAELAVAILDGKGTRMPAFAGKISQEQARDLAVYIRVLGGQRLDVAKKQPKTAVKATGAKKSVAAEDDFDQRFRKLEEEFEQLRKQLRDLKRKPKP